MEKDAVLIIIKVFINLVLPKYTTRAYEVDEAEEMGTSGAVGNQHKSTLQATI
jgi:hypothetical protein